jgi:hypothetical protein
VADKPKLAACTPEEVFKALKKLGGFTFYEGRKHTKVIHGVTGKTSTIPRHTTINKYILRDFVSDFLIRDCGHTEEEVFKHLWC